jgi:hypothetical protein
MMPGICLQIEIRCGTFALWIVLILIQGRARLIYDNLVDRVGV